MWLSQCLQYLMKYRFPEFDALVSTKKQDNGAPGKAAWQPMLQYVAELHGRSTHSPRPPLVHPWEEIGIGYGASQAFGPLDVIHQILDVLPTAPQHARQQILNNLVWPAGDAFLLAASGSKAVNRSGRT
jgi:hypothetical protein